LLCAPTGSSGALAIVGTCARALAPALALATAVGLVTATGGCFDETVGCPSISCCQPIEPICPIIPDATCGDGVMAKSEACDDGNQADGDGCDATCTTATCFVPKTHATVAAGLADAACSTLYVYSGTYAENVVVAREVTVVAVGDEPVAVDGGAAGTTVTIASGVTATLRGFMIRNGQAAAGGGIVNNGTLTLDDMIVHDNVAVAENPAGGGIDNAGTLTLTASLVTHNRLASTATPGVVAPVLSGAGIRSTAGTVRLDGASRVAANEIISAGLPGATGQGAGIQAQSTVVDITGASVVRDNVLDIDGHPGAAVATGAGLSLNGGMLTLEAGSVIEGNSAIAKGVDLSFAGATATGGGFHTTSTLITLDTAFVRNNQAVAVSERHAFASAGAGAVRNGSLQVTGTEITGNIARAEGLGVTSESAFATVGGLSLDGLSAQISDSQLSSNVVSAATESTTTAGSASVGALSATTFFASQTVELLRCTLDGNIVKSSDGDAATGALAATLGTGSGTVLTVHVEQTTISNNAVTGATSAQNGAAIARAGTGDTTVNLDFVTSTVSSNRADAPTGTATTGAILGTTGTGSAKVNVNLASTTITRNSAIGMTGQFGGLNLVKGISSSITTGSLKNTIVADNTATTDPDCRTSAAPITSGGYNLIGDLGSCTLGGDLTGNRTGAAGLGLLGNNGGPTKTHALTIGSQAINAANPAACADLAGAVLSTDQRGLPRVTGGRCDIGAFER
jgi:cysteine-rich repeat protein